MLHILRGQAGGPYYIILLKHKMMASPTKLGKQAYFVKGDQEHSDSN